MIFHDALTTKQHVCFLKPDTRLPMMYIDDVLRATVDFMDAPKENLKMRTYNVTAMSFTPEELAAEVKKYVPELEVIYQPDHRQGIGEIFGGQV
jgi:threonine 3-dehydrogenase